MGFEWDGSKSRILFYKRIADPFHDQLMERKLPNALEFFWNDL